MAAMIEKLGFYGSVTAVAHARISSLDVLIWSNAGTLFWWDRMSSVQGHCRVFDHHYVHEIKVYEQHGVVVVLGNKSLAMLQLSLTTEGSLQGQLLFCNSSMDDLILDAVMTDFHTENNYTSDCIWRVSLLAGFARNFYDEVQVTVGTNGRFTWTRQQRHRCPDICALFSLTISVDSSNSNQVLIISGNVFGKLILWKRAETTVSTDSVGEILSSVHKHEGVIFRVVWNINRDGSRGSQIATVSDDRTLRLWTISQDDKIFTFHEVFVGWGHTSRLWDVLFLENSSCALASCSEDGTIRLWNHEGESVATLQGHSGCIWRLSLIPSQADQHNSLLMSAGNDGAVKLWDVQWHSHTSPTEEMSTVCRVLIPSWPEHDSTSTDLAATSEQLERELTAEEVVEQNDCVSTTDTQKSKPKKSRSSTSNNSRRKNGVSLVRVSPCGRFVVVVLLEGGVWLLPLDSSSSEPIDYSTAAEHAFTWSGVKAGKWVAVTHLRTQVLVADCVFLPNLKSDAEEQSIWLAVVSVGGQAAIHQIDLQAALRHCTPVEGSKSLLAQWTPHTKKTVNVWFLASNTDQLPKERGEGLQLVTATVEGVATIWTLHRFEEEARVESLFSLVTGRKEIVCSAYRLVNPSIDSHLCADELWIGDSRGGVNVYTMSDSNRDNESIRTPTQFFALVHKSDPVSAFCVGAENSMISAGHDGSINQFHRVGLMWVLQNSTTSSPVQTPSQLSNSVISGYHGSSFLVYDTALDVQQQLLRVEGGGWKRPHHCRLVYGRECWGQRKAKSIVFVCPAPVGKTDTELMIFGHLSGATQTSSCHYPLQLSTTTFSNVSNCSAIIAAPLQGDDLSNAYLALGGEDCAMRAYHLPLSPITHARDLAFEATLSKNSNLKTMSVSYGDDQRSGLLAAAGGKLLFYLWIVQHNEITHKTSMNISAPVLQKIYAGSIGANASQDHRILAIESRFLQRFTKAVLIEGTQTLVHVDQFVLLCADSRGWLSVVDVQCIFDSEQAMSAGIKQVEVRVVDQLEVSTCPLLSCDALFLSAIPGASSADQTKHLISCAVGDTKGLIYHLLLPVEMNSTETASRIAAPFLLSALTAHDMGANSLSLLSVPVQDDVCLITFSGGDDQSLSVTMCTVSIHWEGGSICSTLRDARIHRKQGAAGAALKGSRILTSHLSDDHQHIVLKLCSVAYDQRLCLWKFSASIAEDRSQESDVAAVVSPQFTDSQVCGKRHTLEPLHEHTADMNADLRCEWTWMQGAMTHVMEVSHLCVVKSSEQNRFVASVAGQGVQTFRLTIQ